MLCAWKINIFSDYEDKKEKKESLDCCEIESMAVDDSKIELFIINTRLKMFYIL